MTATHNLVRPFRALRPRPETAADIIAPLYDVVSTDEARAIASGRPDCFLHVSRPEIDLPAGADPHSSAVYARGAENLARLAESGVLVRDNAPSFYIWRLTSGSHVQTGVALTASLAAYERNQIRKHELTRPDKETDRVEHMHALNAQVGPVLCAHRANARLTALVTEASEAPPLFEVEGPNAVAHTLWRVDKPEAVAALGDALNALDALYIADGHHRSAAALRVAERLRRAAASTAAGKPRDRSIPFPGHGDRDTGQDAAEALPAHFPSIPSPEQADGDTGEEAGKERSAHAPLLPSPEHADRDTQASHEYFLVVTFPHDELRILDYNRVIADLGGRTPAELLGAIAQDFEVERLPAPTKPNEPATYAMYLDRQWYRLRLREADGGDGPVGERTSASVTDVDVSRAADGGDDPVAALDISRLQRTLIEPLFGIADPRIDERIDFVGGIRGLEELERRVDSGDAAIAFALHPTSMEQLMAVADAELLMPPKSTWFEPKLAGGLLSHVFEK